MSRNTPSRTTRLLAAAAIAALAVLAAPAAFAADGASAEERAAGPDKRPSVAMELGGGVWLADFADRLVREGAFTETYALAFTFRLPVGATWGFEGLLASACVIHPESTPIEGTFVYQSAGLYATLPIGPASLGLGASAGFQHATWLIQPYSSAFYGLSLDASLPVDSRSFAFVTLRGRRSFFLAHTIPAYYGSGTMDNPTSLQAAVGLGYFF